MIYTITTGQLEKGTGKQQAAFIQIFGAENAQYRFDLYFHWYNIAHEYGHCLCDFYGSDIIGLKQELLVNRFAVSLWKYAGQDETLDQLQKMLDEILQKMQTPVPEHMSFTDFYEQIWGTEQMMEVPIYGYLQFKSVHDALRGNAGLAPTLREMGIPDVPADIDCIRHGDIVDILPRKYAVCSQTATKALHDLQCLLHDLGIEQPTTAVKLVDDPAIHCVEIS